MTTMEFLVASLLIKSALGTLLVASIIARVILAVPSSGMVSCVGLSRGAMAVPMPATLVSTQRFSAYRNWINSNSGV